MTEGDLTTAQLARRLRRPLRTVQRWIAQGRITGTKLPGRTGTYLIAKPEVERAVRTLRAPAERKSHA